ncbi:hypothetical protein TWF192_004149 [Orbilia oligospora]|uniref:Uncharacterized protein n=1 Tax=Orbilia oligospora TaxID=2813651 RepID=A0A6G1MMZ7_ORBOL|nr:hypothetical protein TWF679_007321 [Orbilia oligospora]KAF3264467.1 hypothetical protein TWF192_004149 [Orbilia oligospora]
MVNLALLGREVENELIGGPDVFEKMELLLLFFRKEGMFGTGGALGLVDVVDFLTDEEPKLLAREEPPATRADAEAER